MKFRKTAILLAAAALLMPAFGGENEGAKEQEKPFQPYVGEITAKRVYVRSGRGTNFTPIARANTGYRVLVVGQAQEWLKIRMPPECLLWIWKSYVDLDPETKIGKVNADSVNVRVAPELGADVVGQVAEGMQVEVTGGEGDWYEIKPPATTAAWVHSDYVRKVGADE